jgi:hypothetical protein
MMTEHEIAREARRILRRLAVSGASLVDGGQDYVVLSPNAVRTRVIVGRELVDIFRRRDWLRPRTIRLPPCGEAGAMSDSEIAPGGGGCRPPPPTRSRIGARDLPTMGEVKEILVISDAGLGWLRRALAEEGAFAAQHQLRARRTITDDEGIEHMVTVNEGESPLGWLRNRRGRDGKPLIDATQLEAGEKLRRDFTLAQMTPRLAVDFAAPVLGGKRGVKADAPLAHSVLAAKQRVRHALAHVGPGLADLLIDVCCHLVGLEEAERDKGWPKRSGRIVLTIALDRLAEHYGMRVVAPARSRRIRAWHAPEEKEA